MKRIRSLGIIAFMLATLMVLNTFSSCILAMGLTGKVVLDDTTYKISGTITLKGEAVEGQDVELYDALWNKLDTATSNKLGAYEFSTPRANGEYILQSICNEYKTKDIIIDGEDVIQDFAFGAYSISGNITLDGVNLENHEVSLYHYDTADTVSHTGAIIETVQSNTTGYYEFTKPVLSGKYVLVTPNGGSHKHKDIIVSDADVTQNFELVSPGEIVTSKITGIVKVDGEAAVGAEARLVDSFGKTEASAITNGTGHFELHVTIPTDTYSLNIYINGKKQDSKSVKIDGRDLDEIFEISGKYSVGGNVTLNGTEAYHADIELFDDGGDSLATTHSDNNGNYWFDGIRNGDYKIIAKIHNTSEAKEANITVSDGTVKQNFAFEGAGYKISGNIKLDGAGVQGQIVKLYASGKIIDNVYTDETGNYVFNTPRPNGNYKLSVNMYSIAALKEVEIVIDKADITQDFTFTAPPVYKVSGTVRLNGMGVKNADVYLRDISGNSSEHTTSNNVGYYEFEELQLNGGYYLEANGAGKNKQVSIRINGANINQDIPLEDAYKISGNVTLNGAGMENARVYLENASGHNIDSVYSNGDGKFEFDTPRPNGDYKLSTDIKSKHKKTVDITIANADVTKDFEFELYKIRGNITLDGVGMKDKKAELYDNNGNCIDTAYSGGTGIFKFADAQPNGAYIIVVYADATGDNIPESKEVSITINGADITRNIAFGTEMTYKISGNVTSDDANLNDVKILLYNTNGVEIDWAPVDSTGYYEFENHRLNGDYILEAYKKGNGKQLKIKVNDADVNQDIALEEAYKISGNIMVNGRDVDEVKIELFDTSGNKVRNKFKGNQVYYELTSIANGRYKLIVTMGDTLEAQEVYVVVNGADVNQSFEFVLATDKQNISGQVTLNGVGVKADVKLYTSGSNQVHATDCDANGNFNFRNMWSGKYELDASAQGKRKRISVDLNDVNIIESLELEETYTISGYISSTDGGVSGVSVELDSDTGIFEGVTQSKINGYYEFKNVIPNKNYKISMSYNNKEAYIKMYNKDVRQDFKIIKGEHKISGIVTLDGVVLEDAEVQLKTTGGTYIDTARSDNTGYYEFATPRPNGKYNLEVYKDGEFGRGVDITIDNANITKDVELESRGHFINGHITVNGSGNNIGAEVRLYNAMGAKVGVGIINSNGGYRIEFRAPNGKYKLIATAYGIAEAQEVYVTVNNADVIQDFAFVYTGHKISGNITLNGVGVSGETVYLYTAGNAYPDTSATSDFTGYYEFSTLKPNGDYRLDVYLSSASERKEANITINDMDITQNFAFVKAKSHSIRGQVTCDGVVAPNIQVDLYEESNTSVQETVYTDGSGNYSFTATPAGVYRVEAIHPTLGSEAKLATVVDTDLSIDFAFTTPIVPTTYTISGQVTLDGVALANKTVSLWDRLTYSETVTTNSKGYYVSSQVGKGDYNVVVSHMGESKSATVQVHNESATQDFAFSTPTKPELNRYKISGTVKHDEVAVKDVYISLLDISGIEITNAHTDKNGYYEFIKLTPGKYNISATNSNGKVEIKDAVIIKDDIVVNFSSTTPKPDTNIYKISGTVSHDGVASKGRVMYLQSSTGVGIADTLTNENGYYEFAKLDNGYYGVMKQNSDGSFTEKIAVIKDKDVVVDFKSGWDPNAGGGEDTVIDRKISGTVTLDGVPLADKSVTLHKLIMSTMNESSETVKTDSNGYYEFIKLSSDVKYTAEAVHNNMKASGSILWPSGIMADQEEVINLKFVTPPIIKPDPTPNPRPDPTPDTDPTPDEPVIPEVITPVEPVEPIIVPPIVPVDPYVPAVVQPEGNSEPAPDIEEEPKEETAPAIEKAEDKVVEEVDKAVEEVDTTTKKTAMAKFMEVLKKILIIAGISLLVLLGVGLIMLALLAWFRRVKVFNNINTDDYKDDEWELQYRTFIKKEDKGIYEIIIPEKVIEKKTTDLFEIDLNKAFVKKHNGDLIIVKFEGTELQFSFELYEKENIIAFDYSTLTESSEQ